MRLLYEIKNTLTKKVFNVGWWIFIGLYIIECFEFNTFGFIYLLIIACGYVLWWTFSIFCGLCLERKIGANFNAAADTQWKNTETFLGALIGRTLEISWFSLYAWHILAQHFWCLGFLYPCKGYNDFSQKSEVRSATQWRRRFRPHKVYIFLISMTRRVDLAMSVCASVRLSVRFYLN